MEGRTRVSVAGVRGCQRSYRWSLSRVGAGACPGTVGCGGRGSICSSRLIVSMLERLAESRIGRSLPVLTAARMARGPGVR